MRLSKPTPAPWHISSAPSGKSLDTAEIDEILVSRVRYSQEDLTLVDWEAAIIIAPQADFQSDIELLKIGNYQLLRYRILDQSIEEISARHQPGVPAGKTITHQTHPLLPAPHRHAPA